MKILKWAGQPHVAFWLNTFFAVVNLFFFYLTHSILSICVAGLNLAGAWMNLKTLEYMEKQKHGNQE